MEKSWNHEDNEINRTSKTQKILFITFCHFCLVNNRRISEQSGKLKNIETKFEMLCHFDEKFENILIDKIRIIVKIRATRIKRSLNRGLTWLFRGSIFVFTEYCNAIPEVHCTVCIWSFPFRMDIPVNFASNIFFSNYNIFLI